MMEGSPISEICSNEILSKVEVILSAQKEKKSGSNRTAKLWIQYMNMVDIMKKFIRAERLGNWHLHLEATQQMLPYIAASGHNNYLKSVYLYLQKMNTLPEEHPDVYQSFLDGHHVTRSDRQWAGLSTNLIIEQVLIRSLKTSGGLTRGRGMTEQQRTIWTLAMPKCAEINHTMQELSGGASGEPLANRIKICHHQG